MIIPGVNYSLTYPVTNGCTIAQEATINYPGNLPLTGPKTVHLEPGQTVPVAMDLSFPTPPPDSPAPPANSGEPSACLNEAGSLVSIHPQAQWTTTDDAGNTVIHTCLPAEEHYQVGLCLLPYSPGSGESGGKLKRPQRPGKKIPLGLTAPDGSTCSNLWYFNVFVSSGQTRQQEDCATYIRAEAHNLFDKLLASYRAANPAEWAWVPTGSAIDQLTVQQILTIKNLVFDNLAKLTQ